MCADFKQEFTGLSNVVAYKYIVKMKWYSNFTLKHVHFTVVSTILSHPTNIFPMQPGDKLH